MVYRGIDISKSSFVAAYPSTNGNPTKTFPNTTAGMRELIGTLAVAEHHCVMEATSNYGCCCTCYIRTVLPSVLPPPKKKQIKHFSRMMMPVTKTDEKDAYIDVYKRQPAACCCRPSTNTSQAFSNVWAKTAPIPAMKTTASVAAALPLSSNTNTASRTLRSKS